MLTERSVAKLSLSERGEHKTWGPWRMDRFRLSALAVGCMLAVASGVTTASAEQARPAAEHGRTDHERHGDTHGNRVPAPEGMAIQIVQPESAARFAVGNPIMVEVRTQGLDASGDHWHVYCDGELEAMVGGGRTVYELSLSGKEPGEHELEVTVSNAKHQEYDINDRVTIVVGPPSSGAAGSTTVPKRGHHGSHEEEL